MNNSKKLFLLIGALSMLLTACGSNNSSLNDDGTKTAKCLIYVKADGRPDYYLTGTINGYTVSTGTNNAGTYTYPALPLSTNHYLIPDVELLSGDKLVVRANVGNISPLKDRYNQTYEYIVTKNMSAHIYLNTDALSCNYNYLNVVEKS